MTDYQFLKILVDNKQRNMKKTIRNIFKGKSSQIILKRKLKMAEYLHIALTL